MGSVHLSCLHNLPHDVAKVFIEQSIHYFGSGEELWAVFLSCSIQKLCKMTKNFSSVSSMLTHQCLLILLNFGGRTLWLKGSQKIQSSCNCRKVSITLKLREKKIFFLSGFLFLKSK